MPRQKNALVFVDTNILLDFYRVRRDAGLSLLQKLDVLQEHIITTYQVEMEFKKNRQTVIHESLLALKMPESSLAPPAFLSQAKNVAMMNKEMKDIKRRAEALKDRLKMILEKPQEYDPVYKAAQRLFTNSSDLNLRRSDARKLRIRRLAWKRFILGYPPRKRGDTSTGDAINWEWIVHCIERKNRNVIIVSRDSDYGLTHDGNSYPNDWLVQEIKSRVNLRRKLTLVDRLSTALKMLEVTVTQEQEKEEMEMEASDPYGIPVADKPGYVTSPFAPNMGYVDVRGFPPGTQVRDPYSGKVFMVP